MKSSNRSILLFISMLVVIGMACQGLSGGGETPAPIPTLPPVPTEVSIPTSTLAPTKEVQLQPTSVPTVGSQEFFTEEFEDDRFFDDWYYFLTGPGEDKEDDLTVEQSGDGLNVDLGALEMYFYFIYDPKNYTDVKITMVAENLGRNNNNVSLICRMDIENGTWYEFSVESGGVWYLYAISNGYTIIDSGGTTALKQGQAINEYGMECNGDTITMYINGEKLKSFPDRVYGFTEGEVGFNISSLNVLPITVNVKSFDIAQP